MRYLTRSALAMRAGLRWLRGCAVREASYQCPPRPAPVVGVPVGAEVEVGLAPPVPVAEVRIATPGVDFAWIPGGAWQGRWAWEGGR